eukprot:SAG11_NODE_9924_length_869_cov_1.816883_1_plen_179_part_10
MVKDVPADAAANVAASVAASAAAARALLRDWEMEADEAPLLGLNADFLRDKPHLAQMLALAGYTISAEVSGQAREGEEGEDAGDAGDAEEEEEWLRAEFSRHRISALKKRALQGGATPEQLEEVNNSRETPRETVVALLLRQAATARRPLANPPRDGAGRVARPGTAPAVSAGASRRYL